MTTPESRTTPEVLTTTGQLTTTDPLTTDSLTTDPLATDPLATDPLATDPLATDPLATDPLATDPLATDQLATDQLTTTRTGRHAMTARAPAAQPPAAKIPAAKIPAAHGTPGPGSRPAAPPPIPLTRPSLDKAELAAVAEVFESGWVAGQGPRCLALEADFKRLTGRRHAVAVNSCTSGLHLALAGLGLRTGDEVIVADYSFPATGNAVLYCGASPVFVDVRADTGTIDPGLVDDAVSPRTRAIIAVDALGVPADWSPLEQIAWRHGLVLIEDAACSAGGSYSGRPCGSFGEAAVFSLHARNSITCGEGGVVTTDDGGLAERVRRDACFGMENAFERQPDGSLPVPTFPGLGYNYQLSDILAAVASVQFGKIEQFMRRRSALAARYAELLADIPGILLPVVPSDRSPTWQSYAVTVEQPLSRDAIAVALRAQGIGCSIGTYALHQQAVYGSGPASCPVSGQLFERHLALPMYTELTDADQLRVAGALAKAVSEQ